MLALVIGSLYFVPLAIWWGYIAQYNPLIDYIMQLATIGWPTAFWIVVSIQDFLFSLVLMLPLAFLVFRIQPTGSWLYLFVAVIACKATELFPVWSRLGEHLESVGVVQFIHFLFLMMGPALIDYWFLKRRS